jgi:hypothetical protein
LRGWYLPPQKIPFAENRFLLAGKGAENTKKKSRQCFPALKVWERGLSALTGCTGPSTFGKVTTKHQGRHSVHVEVIVSLHKYHGMNDYVAQL